MVEQLTALASKYGQVALDYLMQPAVYIQLGLIVALFLPALLLSNRVEPWFEERARGIKGMPGLLRVVIAFLRRFEWLFFVALLGIAYVITTAIAWPANNYLIYSALLLSAAWLLISVTSHAIRSRLLRKLFAYSAWIYVAASILGIVDDTAAMLDNAGFSLGS